MKNQSVLIVGGGINGLCSAYFLEKQGFEVTILDRDQITNNCSFGNMGYVSPSHYTPLASPGIISEGLKYLLSSRSPFYMKPRLDFNLMRWALTFYRNSSQKTVDKHSGPLVDLLSFSKRLMEEINEDLGNQIDMETKGIMMMCHSSAAFEKQKNVAQKAKDFSLATRIIDKDTLQKDYEPDVELNVSGAVLYTDDAHINPSKLMLVLKNNLMDKGVDFKLNTEVLDFEKNRETIQSVITNKGNFSADYYVLAPGSWLGELTKKLGHRLLIEGGKGYSTTYDYLEKNLHYPALLIDDRCAVTPWGKSLRIGGTMELVGLNNQVTIKRMEGIYNSVKKFYPGLDIAFPSVDKIWSGFRPVTPDGLPYIGPYGKLKNAVIAGGTAMLGISEGAGMGKLVSQIITQEPAGLDLSFYRPNRFD